MRATALLSRSATTVVLGVVVLVLASALMSATSLTSGVAEAQDAQGESTPVEADEAIGRGQTVIRDGHVDVGPKFIDGEWTLLVRDDTVDPSVWRRLPDVVLQASDAAVLQVPDDPQFAFLGTPGASVWVLPQVQQPGILWPGWNTQDPEVSTTIDREVTWILRGTEGPGDFVLFVNRDFGQPETAFDSRQPGPQELGIEANTHAHGNWAFTAPGVYLLDVEMSTVTGDGEELSATGTLRIAVGDATDPQAAFALETADSGTSSQEAPPGPGADARGDSSGAASSGDESSTSPLLWLGGVLVALAAVAVAVVLARRARRRHQASSAAGSPPEVATGTGVGPQEDS